MNNDHSVNVRAKEICGVCDSIQRGFEPLGYVYPVTEGEACAIVQACDEPDNGYVFRCEVCGGFVPVV